jgi:hypothetical protein
MRRQSTVRGRQRRATPVGRRFGLAALTIVTAGVGLWVAAPAAQAETELAVDAGWSGRYRPGHPVPVWVEVRADRLIRGTLELSADDGTSTSMPIEVPGGSVKEFLLVVPTSPHDDEVTIRASVRAGDERASGEAEVSFDGETELVGLLPAVTPADLPAPVSLPFETGVAAFVEITADELAVPASLAALGTLVAGPDELAQLPADARLGVLAWIDAGGRLLVDGPAGTEVGGLPDAWQPDGDGRTVAGMGEVRLIAGAAAASRWTDVLEPTPSLVGANLDQIVGGIGMFPISDTVARDAGLRLTTPGWLLAFLVAYVVVAGPITWFVLRRLRRPGLAWAVIPVVAVVFAATSFVVGRDLRSGTQAAHGSIITSGPAGAEAITFVGTVSKNGGDGRVRLPEGWTASTVDQSWFGLAPEAVSVAVGADGSLATIPLDAGEFGVLRARGPTAFTGALEVEASATADDAITGTVRNTTDLPLDEVGVFAGPHGDHIGRLEPGEEASFEIDTDAPAFPQGEPAEADVWPAALGWDRPINVNGIVNLALWTEAAVALGPNFLAPGSVVAAGWTRDASTPARAGDDDVRGRSLVLGRGPVESQAGAFNPLGVRHETLRNGDSAVAILERFEANRRGEFFGHLIRLHLPADAPTEGLQLRVGPDVSAVEVLASGGWQTIDNQVEDFDPNVGAGPGGERTLDLPAGSVTDGTILLRVVSNFFFGPIAAPGLQVEAA